MREILFRGKRLDNGEWVEGNLFIPDKVTRVAPTEILVGTNVIRISYEIDPSSVSQFIGLCDKNGKKIFEGDIVLVSWSSSNNTVSETYVVVYSKSGFFCKDKERLLGQLSNYVYRNARTIQCEVIGNIHDNPELLEGGG